MTTDPMTIVNYYDLISDGCNFKDRAFENFVNEFMNRFMPGFPMGILGEQGEHWQFDDWEFEAGEDYSVKEEEVADPNDAAELISVFMVFEDGTAVCPEDHLDTEGDYPERSGDAYINTGRVPYWLEEGEAQEAADELNRHESVPSYGFPWANSWCYLPDDRVTADELQAAGFLVAEFRGYTVAGIDGGGYSFAGQHFAKLCGIVYANRAKYHWKVNTDDGPRLVKMGD